ncbi:DUF3943 domain-containing protein [Dysgonomonas sp. 520]|uniref:DUF3943 domain-containing protein n=1 Tax=Dysgonomonas sp. 520 TaxID=2302931 RepID=UPI002104AAEE|nr:DUF3943 domain-containing protein [Dysgonomonas sp. 520]
MRKQLSTIRPADSIDIAYYGKRNWWSAAGQVVGLNMGIWAFDRYVTKSDFAYINARTIKANFKHGFVWDNDQLGTNMFLHPYHGSMYFNAARSNGFSYLGSSAFALGGSLMWEMFLENEYPSINDVIATPIGGTIFGEVFHRASDMVIDDRKTGRERVVREVAAFLITPTRGLSRLINGDTWKKRSTSGRQHGIPNVSIETSIGIRGLELEDPIIDEGLGGALMGSIEYGERYETDGLKPYDYFSLRAGLYLQKGQPILGQINVMGRIWGGDLVDNKTDYLNIGVYQHFDYYDSDTISDVSNKIPYKFGTPASFGVGLMHKSKRLNNWNINSHAHFSGIILGGSLSDHYVVDKRQYNLGSGFSWLAGGAISYKDKIGVSMWHEGYRLFTWKGYPKNFNLDSVDEKKLNYQGDHSNASFSTTNFKIDIKLKKQFYLTSMFTYYRRSTAYQDFKNVYSQTNDVKLMLTYKY